MQAVQTSSSCTGCIYTVVAQDLWWVCRHSSCSLLIQLVLASTAHFKLLISDELRKAWELVTLQMTALQSRLHSLYAYSTYYRFCCLWTLPCSGQQPVNTTDVSKRSVQRLKNTISIFTLFTTCIKIYMVKQLKALLSKLQNICLASSDKILPNCTVKHCYIIYFSVTFNGFPHKS